SWMPPWVTTPIVYTRNDAVCCGSVVEGAEPGSATTRTYGFSGKGGSPSGKAIVRSCVPTAVADPPAWSSVGAWPDTPGGIRVIVSTGESLASSWPSADRYTPNESGAAASTGRLTWYSIVTLCESVVVAEIICTAGAATEDV